MWTPPSRNVDMWTSTFGFSHFALSRIRESILYYLLPLVRGMFLQRRCQKVTTQTRMHVHMSTFVHILNDLRGTP
jgi:hypothetical protein